jgi:mannosyltransferase
MRGLQSEPAAMPDRQRPDSGRAQDDRPATRRLPGWLVIALPVLLEVFVGGYRISVPSFWRDEGYTITGSQRPVSAIFALIQHQDAFHALYLLLMHPVIAVFGRSEVALRVPSLIAMCLAVGLTAALGRRLAQASGLPRAPVVGLLAGLLLAGLPVTTRYAQEGRPYALTMLFAVLATYLLVVAVARGGWRWWALYGAALLVTGLFDLAAVLLAGTHGLSLLMARRGRPADGAPAAATASPASGAVTARALRRWLVACVAAAIALSPVLVYSFRQSAQLDWVQPPNLQTLLGLLRDFAGATPLIPVAGLLVLLGCIAGRGLRNGRELTLARICLPWMVLPPALLLVVSLLHPVYVDRYILFCVPAFALLASAGLAWLVVLARRRIARRVSGRRANLLSFVPSAALAVFIVVMVIGPQAEVRLSYSRADNLRVVAAVLAARERPGDAILYLPRKTAVIGMAYPDPFRKLNDIGLLSGPIASGTLRGVAAPPSVVASRLPGVKRIWTIEWTHPLAPDSSPPPALVKLLTPMRMSGSWLIQSVLVVLYTVRSH